MGDYYDNTFIWFTTDNGPEVNCGPEGFCGDNHYKSAPGDAGPLRGRKRDLWEGGHRVPTIVSWPAVQTGPARVSWDTVVTMDFLATMMDAISVDRPATQTNWGFDGKSILPILRGEQWPERAIGYVFQYWKSENTPHGFRYGKWKYVKGSQSCQADDCHQDMLFDLESDLGEKNEISAQFPDVLKAIKANFTKFFDSVTKSRNEESLCGDKPPPPPTPPPTPSPPPSDGCDWHTNTGLSDSDMKAEVVETKEDCCELCKATEGCVAADFNAAYVGTPIANPAGVFIETMDEDLNYVEVQYKCHLKKAYSPVARFDGSMACVPRATQLV